MLEIRQTKVFRGPNVWARMPVIFLAADIGELEDRPTDKIDGFVDRLVAAIPSLHDHGCSLGHPGGFIERMREGTWMGHVLEHVALELQNLAGAQVTRGKTRGTKERGVYNVVYEYRQEDVGLEAGKIGHRLLNHLIYGSEPDFDLRVELEGNLIPLAERLAFGPSTRAITEEAERRGIPVLRLDPRRSLVQLGHGCYQKRVWATIASTTSNVGVELASNKEITNRLLRDVGIPSPRGEVVRDVEDAVRMAGRIGYPVVVKPLDGNHGRGVTTDIGDAEGVRQAFALAIAESRAGDVVVESYLTGRDYRILVIDRRVVAVAERVPAHVVGDGERSVRQLIDLANADPRRGIGHEKPLTRIAIDGQTEELLARQGLSLDAIPAYGRFVQLKQTGNMSTGGTAIDRTDEIHPDNYAIARQAAMTLGLDIAGIDFICPDISQSVREVGGGIVEINAAPGFRMHTHPTEGLPRQPGRAVVDMLFPPGTPTRIPIVAVTGTNGKTTTARMIAAIMQAHGKTVGLTTTDGIYIDGTQIAAGDMAGPQSAQMVLKNPVVDYAVLECARGGIVRSGLGFDRCNIAVVTNVDSDHLDLGGIKTLEQLAEVKGVVPASVFRDGCSILNADNHWTVQMARYARGEIIFFGMNEESEVIRDHLRERGRAVVMRQAPEGEVITLIEERRDTPVIYAKEIPATFDGRLRVNIQNAMAAIAAAIGADIPFDCIRDAMRGFTTDYAQTPGRFNLMEIEGRQVLMDYCHNVPALETLADFVRRTRAPHSVGVITVPGDRSDGDIAAFGRLAAETFDTVVIREDDDTRRRERGEIARALKSAIAEAGRQPCRVETILDETEASLVAVDLAGPGDLVVILVDKPGRIWQALQERGRRAAEDRSVARPTRPDHPPPNGHVPMASAMSELQAMAGP
ncbi:MAG: cyanophycin synthetase [Thermomicrobiales bacterium]|nr:cyanophycin synthetase [Thermomicrobiales bacterium]